MCQKQWWWEGGMHPGQHCAGGGIGGAKMEFWNLVASGKLVFALQTVIFLHHLISLTLPQFWDHTPNCQCSTTPHKALYQETYTADLTDHSPAVKLIENPYCPVTVLLAIANQCFALFTCFKILHKITKFYMKFGYLNLRKIVKFVATRPKPSSWIEGAYF